MIQILDNGLSFDANGNFHYAWFKIQKDARTFFRCVALRELAVIPVTDREKYDLLGKQWGALRGLHNAGVNFVYAAMGIYKPEHIGIVQYYGAAGEGENEAKAADRALTGASAVAAVLANFPQSKLAPPNSDWLRWYLEFVTSKSKHIAAILGHPDPRQGHKGSGADGASADDGDTDLASEQNEILFRGLSKLSQNFVYQILAEHIQRPVMSSALVKIAEIASNVASRRKGAIGFGFNLSIPLMAALGQTQSAGGQRHRGTVAIRLGGRVAWVGSQSRPRRFAIGNEHPHGGRFGVVGRVPRVPTRGSPTQRARHTPRQNRTAPCRAAHRGEANHRRRAAGGRRRTP